MYMVYDPELHGTPPESMEARTGAPTLQDGQEIVGGLIERIVLFEDEDGCVDLWVNEEFLYQGWAPSVVVEDAAYYGPDHPVAVHGPCYITRSNHMGETVELNIVDLTRLEFAEKYAVVTGVGLVPILKVLTPESVGD